MRVVGNGRKPKNDVDESTIRSQLDRDELTKLRTSRLLDELEAENFDQNGSDFSLNSPNINLIQNNTPTQSSPNPSLPADVDLLFNRKKGKLNSSVFNSARNRFLAQLWNMVNSAKFRIIEWTDNGSAIIIRDLDKFKRSYLTKLHEWKSQDTKAQFKNFKMKVVRLNFTVKISSTIADDGPVLKTMKLKHNTGMFVKNKEHFLARIKDVRAPKSPPKSKSQRLSIIDLPLMQNASTVNDPIVPEPEVDLDNPRLSKLTRFELKRRRELDPSQPRHLVHHIIALEADIDELEKQLEGIEQTYKGNTILISSKKQLQDEYDAKLVHQLQTIVELKKTVTEHRENSTCLMSQIEYTSRLATLDQRKKDFDLKCQRMRDQVWEQKVKLGIEPRIANHSLCDGSAGDNFQTALENQPQKLSKIAMLFLKTEFGPLEELPVSHWPGMLNKWLNHGSINEKLTFHGRISLSMYDIIILENVLRPHRRWDKL